MKTFFRKLHKQERDRQGKADGYTLLFAVLVASVVLAIGVTILTVSKKEFLLSSSARESLSALYAADSGIECAAYGDQTYNSFATSSSPSGALSCGDDMSPISSSVDGSGAGTFTFSVKFGTGGATQARTEVTTCANIQVVKSYAGANLTTVIQSRGYNTGWNNSNKTCDILSQQKVERALQLGY